MYLFLLYLFYLITLCFELSIPLNIAKNNCLFSSPAIFSKAKEFLKTDEEESSADVHLPSGTASKVFSKPLASPEAITKEGAENNPWNWANEFKGIFWTNYIFTLFYSKFKLWYVLLIAFSPFQELELLALKIKICQETQDSRYARS